MAITVVPRSKACVVQAIAKVVRRRSMRNRVVLSKLHTFAFLNTTSVGLFSLSPTTAICPELKVLSC